MLKKHGWPKVPTIFVGQMRFELVTLWIIVYFFGYYSIAAPICLAPNSTLLAL